MFNYKMLLEMGRGRPKLTEQQKQNKDRVIETISGVDYSSVVRHYPLEDKTNPGNGKIEIVKTQKYVPQPVVMIFRTSNRSNAQVKMKVWTTYNIDYILTAPKIPGLPSKAEILELAVGESFIERFKKQYKIK